jgi:outer membrane receptor protein involved in Fe transport
MALVAGLGSPAMAQSTGAAEPAQIEEVIVTGSKTLRKDADAVGELLTVTQQDMQRAALASVGDLLQRLPSAGVSYNSNGTQGTSFGGSSISLRYLANTDGAADRTLVLVDGHRWVDGTGARGIRDFVDLNTIPIGMIQSIEVLQDGASAIYGADAIAGVVNLKTVSNFEGLRAVAKYGVSSRGDGQEYNGIVNFGRKFGDSAVFLSATYVKDRPVATADRDITRVALTGSLENLAGPPSSPRGLYVLPGFSTSAAPLTQNVGITTATGPSSFHKAALPDDYYNTLAQGVYAIGPSERYGVYGKFTHDFGEDLRLTVDALANRRRSSQVFSPTNLSIGGSAGTFRGFAIAANQPFNPFGVAFAASQPWSIQIFTPQVGNRVSQERVDNYRVSANLEGKTKVGGRDWRWSLFASRSEDEMHFTAPGNIDLEHVALALGNPSACAAQAGCTPLNIFGQMTPDQAAYIGQTAHERNLTQLTNVTFDVTGTLLDLPAGPLALAAGLEWRKNTGKDHPDVYTNMVSTGSGALPLPASTATTTGVARTPTANGSITVKEAYVELTVPVLADMRFAKRLELDLASRVSDYNTVGSKVTSKVGVGYRPVDGVLLRGTWSQGFRAPSLIELFTGARQVNLAGTNTDPCNGGAAAHPNLPGCAGVPASYTQTNFNGGLLPTIVSGNGDIKPETAETWSYGVTLTPAWLPGVTFTADGYKITIHDAIATPAVANALQLCATQGGSFCSILTRDATSGQVLAIKSGFANLNSIETRGYDVSLRYRRQTDIGAWEAFVSATHLNTFDVTSPNPAGGAPIVTHAAGTSTGGTTPATARATYPHWKGLASLTWSPGDWSVTWRTRYIGSTQDGPPPALPKVPVKDDRVHAGFYDDLQFEAHVPRADIELTVGVNNLFDQSPPRSYANAPINFDIYTYDVMGRYFFVRAAKTF